MDKGKAKIRAIKTLKVAILIVIHEFLSTSFIKSRDVSMGKKSLKKRKKLLKLNLLNSNVEREIKKSIEIIKVTNKEIRIKNFLNKFFTISFIQIFDYFFCYFINW